VIDDDDDPIFEAPTTVDDGHAHAAYFDQRGNGVTSRGDDGHAHQIDSFEVQPEGSPPHTHQIIRDEAA
jgi:hypothetical protein